jgi:hypothetical protein
MYESDEWYVQYDLNKDPRTKAKFKAKSGQNQTLADTEDHWDADSSVSTKDSTE